MSVDDLVYKIRCVLMLPCMPTMPSCFCASDSVHLRQLKVLGSALPLHLWWSIAC